MKHVLSIGSLGLTLLALPLTGSTTNKIEPSPPLAITEISVTPQAKLVTLRWTSKANHHYLIEETADPNKGWLPKLSEIKASSTQTTFTISSSPDRSRFFRVREMAQVVSDPETTSTSSSEATSSELESASLALKDPYQKNIQKSAEPTLEATPSTTQSGQPTTVFGTNFVVG